MSREEDHIPLFKLGKGRGRSTAAIEIDDKEEDRKGRTMGQQRERKGTTADGMAKGEGWDDDNRGSSGEGRGE
ncbi:hypothetical protein ACLOJK_006075 [Asimina triloba]